MKIINPQLSGSVYASGSFVLPSGRANQRPSNPVSGSLFFEISDSGSVLTVYNGSGSDGWEIVGKQTTPVIPPAPKNIEYLLIAGGGGGGSYGGGGAGGYLSSSLSSVTSGSTFTVTVGTGGAGSGASYENPGAQGVDSSIAGASISTITALGGGYGGDNNEFAAADGGSGGGGSDGPTDATGGTGTVGQGNDGGDGTFSDPNYVGGGGGGAGTAGGDATLSPVAGGDGGNGLASSITGTSTTRGGGGGGVTWQNSGTAGSAGSGGGGAGGTWNANTNNGSISNATAGTANTGGGGGCGNNGGSGVAIFRYPSSSLSCVGGIELKSSNGDRIHQFNSSATLQVGDSSDFLSPERFPRSSVSSPSVYINPRSIGENGSFVYIPDLGSVGRDFYVGGSGTKINTTGSLADAIDTPYVGASGNSRGFTAGGTSMTTVYSDYSTNQNCSFNCFFRYDPSMQTDTNYPLIIAVTPSTSNNNTAYYGGWQVVVWRGGLSDTGKVTSQIYNSSGTALFTGGINSTTVTSGDQWYMLTVTLSYGASGVQKIYINGSLDTTSDTVDITSFGSSSNRVHLGESYYSATGFNPGGMTFGVTQWWFGTELNSSEITNLYNHYKSDYGLT